MDFVESNRDKLIKSKFADDFYLNILATAEERNMIKETSLTMIQDDEIVGPDGESPTASGNKKEFKRPGHMVSTSIIAFDDQFDQEELVYSVQVNHNRKRIMVCFRGSMTKMDWATNFSIYMQEIPNPVEQKGRDGPDTVKIHNGFRDYLFEKSSRGAKGPHGEPLSEYEEIMQQHVLPVLRQYPKYKLYVTGHSLGAALATLFAFQAASLPDDVVPKPVSCFSFGGPYVGDETFRMAHQVLESRGKLRHLRVVNHRDVVTIVPKMSFRWNIFDPHSHVGTMFKHVGLNLRMFEGDTPMELKYPMVRTGAVSSMVDEMSRAWDQSIFANISLNPMDYFVYRKLLLPCFNLLGSKSDCDVSTCTVSYFLFPATAHVGYHSLREYSKRARSNKPALQSVQLNDLYGRKDIVGVLVAHF